MSINPVSFKGTFCLNRNDLTSKKIEKLYSKQDILQFSFEPSCYINPENLFLHLPDELDCNLMNLLAKLSIAYNRISEADALSDENIVSRMVLNPSIGMENEVLQEINVRKLDEELQKDREFYVGKNGSNGSRDRYERFKKYLRTNQEIKSPIVRLKKYPNGEIRTSIYDGRHRFAVLRDMGIQNMPVTMDEKSIAIAKEIGIIE